LLVDRRHGGRCARIENENIRVGLAQGLWGSPWVRDIGDQRLDAVNLAFEHGEPPRVARHGPHGRALGRERAHNALTKPAAPAGDDRSFAVQLSHDASKTVGVCSIRRSESQKDTVSLLKTTDERSVALCNTWVILV
jgi:hypothetical protein